jgi:protoporphyrinogen oxidase
MRLWTKYSLPMFRILQGNLEEFFITPIRRRLQQLGVQIYTSQGSQVTRLHFRDQAGIYEREVDKVILAIPVERLVSLLDDHIYNAAPDLANIRYLDTQPMAALNIYLAKRIQGLPKNHIFLADSLYGLSFIDVSRIWQGYDATVLNVIASDFTSLEGLSQ